MGYRNTKMYRYLMLLTICSVVGLQGWMSLYNNFAHDVVGMNGFQIGVSQSVREIPGFLALLVIYVLLYVSEHRLAALSIAILGLGVLITGMLPTFNGVLFSTLVMSFGFHYYETVNSSLTLQHFDLKEAPLVTGDLRAIAAVSSIAVGVVIVALSQWLSFVWQFAIIGGFILVAGLYALKMNPVEKEVPVQHKKMVLRKRYWLYYLLTFLAGARRQIIIAFAVFLLVEKFKFSVQGITVLFVVNNIIAYFANPMIGRAINRFGERALLTVEYAFLVAVFLVYAYSDSAWLVVAIYILDNLLFNFAVAVRTFFQKIGDPKDIAPTMAVGFTINHIAAVVIPVFGGALWMINREIPFVAGAVLSVASVAAVQLIPSQLAKVQKR